LYIGQAKKDNTYSILNNMPKDPKSFKKLLHLNMNRTIRILVPFLFLSVGLISCHNLRVGQGDIIALISNVDSTSTINFTEIDVQTDCNVYLTQANFTSVKVTGYENLVPNVTPLHENNKLTILLSDGYVFDNNNINVYITSPSYTKISVNSSAIVNSIDSIVGNKIEIVNNSSGTISLFGDMNLVDAYSAGSGVTRLCGLQADTVNATMFGAGILSTKPLNKLNAQVPGSGQIQFVGNPIVSYTITGNGSIVQTLGCY
jgi:hypothetical protein